jgi:hypothetical protein
MKLASLKSISLMLIASTLLCCSKKNDSLPEPDIDEQNLTDCPAGFTCNYWYTDISTGPFFAATDNNRVFYASTATADTQTTLSFETSRALNSIVLTREDIINGKIKIDSSCPTCYFISYKLTGGFVKGKNLSGRTTRRSPSAKWLIEAKIIRETLTTPAFVDSIYIKQYFYQKNSNGL